MGCCQKKTRAEVFGFFFFQISWVNPLVSFVCVCVCVLMQVPMGIPNFTYMTFLFSLTMVFMVVALAAAAIDPFSEALLSLKSELRDDSASLSDWLLPHSGVNPCDKICACSWSGVKCNGNSSAIVGLNLSMKNLGGTLSGKQFIVFSDLVDLNLSHNSFSGQLPVGIFDLTNLRSLDISRNNFSRQLPKGISNLRSLVVLDAFSNSFSGPLPADVSQLEALKVLNFAGSYFSGPIPSEYGSFKSLDFIHLAGNFLTGKIPPQLGMLRTVTHMEIGYNTYEGGIPWELGNMSALQYLDIAGANLSGPIPKQLSNLTNLDTIFLFRNQLNGQIPWEFCNIIPLQSLDLSDNRLSGTIPESFSQLTNLKLLSLMYNDMSGTVPEGIAKLPQLDTLLIWNNLFTGSLPQDLGRHSNLQYVDVSTNNLVGRIPPNICAGGMLERLILFSNNFTGELYPSLSNCSTLVRLRVEDNSFSGEVSLIFSNLSDISYVDLSRNRFIGGIPNNIVVAKASKLQYLNMSNNPELGGLIPEKLWSLPLLHNFSAASCAISGNLPQFDLCRSVLVIELSQNLLSGTVPDSVLNCQGLVRLDLSNNNLTGHIPVTLATLPAITALDISHNNFTGAIPIEFGNSSSLKLLNVSFNDISGSIPREKSFSMMDSSAFLGNPKLCGAPLRPCHRGNTMPSEIELGSRRTQKLAWVLITCAAIMLFITTAVFGVLHFRKRSKGQWKMVTFPGLPEFTANDVLRSFNSTEATDSVPTLLPNAICKAVLPTGITVSVKKIELEPKGMDLMLQFMRRIGNTRHKNLIRLLGFCYNRHQAYLLYDYLPNGNLAEKIKAKSDWTTKYKIIIGIARGLFFLHHDCYPAIPHGDLKASNVAFDENMEPHLTEYGLSSLFALNISPSRPTSDAETGGEEEGSSTGIMDQLYKDIYNFGEVILEILRNNGEPKKEMISTKSSNSKEILLREIYSKNEIGTSCNSIQEEIIKSVFEVALLCTSSRPSERPSMEEALRLLLELKPQV